MSTLTRTSRISVAERQAPLCAAYREAPDRAVITDSARTSSDMIDTDQPLYGNVTCGTGLPADITTGLHKAVGGESDFPNPGEIFAAAIASCLDSSTRMIANRMGIRLERLSVSVDAKVDVRGTLQVEREVPVGFQSIDIKVEMTGGKGVSDDQLLMLLKAAKRSCVLIQTLVRPPSIRLAHDFTTA